MKKNSRERVFRSRFNRVLSIVIWVVCATIAAGTLAVAASGVGSPWLAAVAAAIAAGTWVVVWRPHVAVDDDAVTVANATHTVTVPWAALVHLDAKYSLRVHVPGRAISASAAPAPGRMAGAMANRGTVGAVARVGDRVAIGELLTTDSGKAAALIRERWDELREAGRIEAGEAASTPVTTRVDIVAAATLVAAAAAVVVAAALGA